MSVRFAFAVGIGSFVATFLLSWFGFYMIDYPGGALKPALGLGIFTGLFAFVHEL